MASVEILDRIVQIINENIADFDTKRDIYTSLIALFEEFDCDDIDQLLGEDEVFDFAFKQLYDIPDPLEDDVDNDGY